MSDLPLLGEVETPIGRVRRAWRTIWLSDFAQKVAGTYLTRVAVMGLGLITTVIIARLLGPTGRGLYAIAVATGAVGVQFANFGLHTSNVYYVARDRNLLPPLIANSLVVSFGVGGLLCLLLWTVLTAVPRLIDLSGATLVLALLWVPFGLAYLLLQNLMLGVQDVWGYNVIELAGRLVALVFLGLIFVLHWVEVTTAFGTTVVVMAISFFWALVRLRRRISGLQRVSWPLFGETIRYATKAYLAGFFCFLVLRADLFMVEHMLGAEQAGYYSIASTMADYISMLAPVIAMILFPKLSGLGEIRTKLRVMRKAAWGTTAILIPLLGISALLAGPAVRFLFGRAFAPATTAFVLLVPGILFLGIHTVTVQFLNSIGYPRSVVFIWGGCTLFNILVNIWAIPRFGIAGASVVSSISYFMAFFLVLLVIYSTARALASSDQGIAA